MSTPRLKRLFAAILTLGFVGLASVFLLELLVRLTLPQPVPQLWLEANERYGHVMRAGYEQDATFEDTDFVMHVRTNSDGFRDQEFAPHNPDVPTVVFAGDSFTFGHGVQLDERFDELLHARLSEAGIEARLLNFGVNAWGTLQATRYLGDHLDELRPDIVVLTFCENDPFDDTYFLTHGISFDRVTFPGKRFLRANSHLFRFVQLRYLLWRKRRTMQEQAAPPAPAPEPEQPLEHAHAAPAIAVADWERTRGYLNEFADRLVERNPDARLILQATSPWDDSIANGLRAIANKHDRIEYLPLEEVVALPESERRLPYDGHWSRAVHQLVADALFEILVPRLRSWDTGE